MFLIYDKFGNYEGIKNYKELKEMVIENLVEETNNFIELDEECKDIVSFNTLKLGELAKKDYVDVKELIDIYEGFGWEIIDIHKLQFDLITIQDFLKNENKDTKSFEVVIDRLTNTTKLLKELN